MVNSARVYQVLILMASLAALLGCGALAPMSTDTPRAATQPPTIAPPAPTLTITPSPTITSTPDWNATERAHETLYPSTPGDEAPCQIVIRTPPPGAPTFIPPSGQESGDPVDPHVAVCSSAQTVRVGEEFALMAHAVDIGLPIYTLRLSDAGQPSQSLNVSFDPQGETTAEDSSQIVDFVRAEIYASWDVIFVLKAAAPGTLEGGISASGEIHYGYPGPATWAGGGSDLFTITVEP